MHMPEYECMCVCTYAHLCAHVHISHACVCVHVCICVCTHVLDDQGLCGIPSGISKASKLPAPNRGRSPGGRDIMWGLRCPLGSGLGSGKGLG